MDPLDAVTRSMQVVKTLMNADKQLEVAELKVKLADVYGDLADIKNQMTDLKSEISELKKKQAGTDPLSKLRSAFVLEERSGYLLLKDELDGHKVGKYCNSCFQKSGHVINLIEHGYGLKCPSCKTDFKNPDAKIPRPISVTRTYPNPLNDHF
jgi:hypothetical protein